MSDELTARLPSGFDLCYQTFGDPRDPALLLVMGLSGPMIWWPEELCSALVAGGFFVIRFDNRDVGRSTWLTDDPVGRLGAARAFAVGSRGRPPYTMSDMADDTVGLLDAVGIDRAHVLGASMGGMIAQTVAIEHRDRVASLVSIMSTTGRRSVGWQHPRVIPMLLRRRAQTRDDYIERSLQIARFIGSTGYPFPVEHERRMAGETYDRGLNPAGAMRQMLAITAQPDRTPALRRLDLPTLVVHGLADKMVHVSGGRATAAAVIGSELMLVPGMGHDLPEPLWPSIVAAITRNARRSDLPPRRAGQTSGSSGAPASNASTTSSASASSA